MIWYSRWNINVEKICRKDFELGEQEICRLNCPYGYFSLLETVPYCLPWLKCGNFSEIQIQREIGSGAVKTVYLASWHGYNVTLNRLREAKYSEDFHHGLQMLMDLHPHPYITQLVGSCKDDYVTQYHRHGSADRLLQLLQSDSFRKYDTLATRFNLCLNYVELLSFLHNSSIGTLVMCDSNDLPKTLSQFLLTSDLHLIANDLDALPTVTSSEKIKCGHREIIGEFSAPEQRWPFPDEPFLDSAMTPYDEKSDIWKIPDVCQHFIDNDLNGKTLAFHLFKIHKKCKATDPRLRPSASEVLLFYKEIWNKFDLHL